MQIHVPMNAEVKCFSGKTCFMCTICTLWYLVFKWNYERLLYGHTFIPTYIRFAPTNKPLNNLTKYNKNPTGQYKSVY